MNRRGIALLATTLLLAACGGDSGDQGGGVPPPPPPPVVQVSIAPADVEIVPSAIQQFACTVTGSTNTQCNWRVQEGAAGGTISAAGLYTAPAATGTYHVIAASAADPNRTATATVRVATPTAATAWVTGYYAGWYWDVMYPPQEVDMTAMTHFVFGRVAPGGGSLGGTPGTVVRGAGTAHDPGLSPDGTRSVEDYLVQRAHAAQTRALLMLGGDGPDGIGFLLSTTDAMRPTFVRNVVDYLVAHDYDGVDIDWENELEGNAGMGVSAAEARRRLMALISDIRTAANSRPRYSGANRPVIVTFPGYAVSINFLEPGGRVEQWQADVANMVDQYNLMSYGAGTAFNGAGWDSWFSGPIFGATGTTPYDLNTSINAYVATGVPRWKIGIGIGFYGIYYGPTITGPRQSTAGNSTFIIDDVALRYNELVRKGYLDDRNGTYHWDDTAKASYRSYGAGGYVPAIDPASPRAGYLSYDDERSIAAKGSWVRETGVGGTILWTINYGYLPQSRTNPLLAATKRAFLPQRP
ncbi:glycoside hydrolase family 18 protein [Sphingomonas sp. LaA6.9]|uniref:glycosyl hydrolase family 18 protein n=1 Tax=Sphingomonas sp. LaA6.9 TaxID=2919914 RepID=UPI001F502B79|nr:glycoside hydrolase family 18 protein [Sphingomonas sp. LaA6.9]MCJ8158430.1 glycoside hydrolase family 18 protein [Sphingomonas sp. LaA6.9]